MEKNYEISYSSKLDDYGSFTSLFEIQNDNNNKENDFTEVWVRKKIKVSVEIRSSKLYKDYVLDFDILKYILAEILPLVEGKYIVSTSNNLISTGKLDSNKCFLIKEKNVGLFYLCRDLLNIFIEKLNKNYSEIIKNHENLTVELKLNDDNEVYCVEQVV
jgi:hypothetical protein